nr:PREDICTED: uncharacterized protein LOC106700850 [Bos mutus]
MKLIHSGKTHKQHPETVTGTKKSSALELKLPPDFHPNGSPIGFPSRVPLQTCPGSGVSKHPSIPPNPELALRRSPHFLRRVSCGVYVTVCPLACKQKAQPKWRSAPGAAPWPQELRPPGSGVPQVGAELSVSSATCCSRVLRLPSFEEGLCRRRALLQPLQHLPAPTALSLGVLASSSRPAAGGQGRGDAARPRSAAVAGRGGRVQHGSALRWGRAPAPFC